MAERGCDAECDGSGYFWTMNKDGRYGPLFPRRMPCPYHPTCREVCRHEKLERKKGAP